MYRVYRLIGGHRYYWCGRYFWNEWPWAAKLLPLEQAQQIAQTEHGHVEPIKGL